MKRRRKLPKGKPNPRAGSRRPGSYTMTTDFYGLTEKDVADIQEIYRRGLWTQKEIASCFGVSVHIVSKCVRCDPYWRRQQR